MHTTNWKETEELEVRVMETRKKVLEDEYASNSVLFFTLPFVLYENLHSRYITTSHHQLAEVTPR